ncbi:MAG: OmpH family outer membrane protein [Flavobacteriales bacterium]|nr:OmpH family outer membrane protein [Flavobacteriales bacterium]MBK6893250.1 OmpH family outer membrane protein [Flavobacteriales bacterium]MBK7249019.1 OmpH family outer membrane protein [Flavobacteriales bacterium]MBK7288502.1 OmpH family outer membrane protein [Flavobacteriales bacterium]MBK9599944.1 OmpH family outer membrane protein [Flavobacteriales bacterium]
MTRHLLRTALMALLLTGVAAHAQRIAFVDTKYILEQMPEYAAAQQELDLNSKKWQDEIDDRWGQIKRLREAFNAEAILLTEEMKKSRQEEISKKEQEARDVQQKRFGVGGDLFKKRQELIQPIQDRIFDAVKEVAGTSYVAIFDIGGVGNNVLYASEKYDKSDSVLRKLGIRPGKDGKNSGNLRGNDDDDDNGGNATPEDDGGKMSTPSKGGKTTTPDKGGSDRVQPNMKPKQ